MLVIAAEDALQWRPGDNDSSTMFAFWPVIGRLQASCTNIILENSEGSVPVSHVYLDTTFQAWFLCNSFHCLKSVIDKVYCGILLFHRGLCQELPACQARLQLLLSIDPKSMHAVHVHAWLCVRVRQWKSSRIQTGSLLHAIVHCPAPMSISWQDAKLCKLGPTHVA